VDPEDGFERRLHPDEYEPHARRGGDEDARSAPAPGGIPPEHEQRAPVPRGGFSLSAP